MLDPFAVSADKMFDLVQASTVYVRSGRAVVGRWSLVVSKPAQFASTVRSPYDFANDHRRSANDRGLERLTTLVFRFSRNQLQRMRQ